MKGVVHFSHNFFIKEKLMDGVTFYRHPTEGMFAIKEPPEEGKKKAQQFAATHYPDTRTICPHSLTGWWLVENDGKPFFRAKPWPLVFGLYERALIEQMGGIPRYVILLTSPNDSFGFQKADSREEARQLLEQITQGKLQFADNQHEGITGTWVPPGQSEPVIVAYAVAVQ